MKRFILMVLMMFLASSANAALHKETVEYKQGEAILEGYLVYDDAITTPRPGILVVHEWKGLNEYAKNRADMLALEGYVAFAADIYGKGIRPNTVEEAGATAGKYKADRPLLRARVAAALDVLKNNPQVDAQRTAAIGYCFGGTTVLELARSGVEVKGIVSFHGGLSSPHPEDARNIKARLLVLHGADDPFVPADEVGAFKKEMDEAHVNYIWKAYPGAVHGFTNPSNTGEIPGALYNQAADKDSWAQMITFFKEVLK